MPDYFVMVYAIITGAHFFPYAWYYKLVPYAIMAGVISSGALLFGLILSSENMYIVSLFMSGCLVLLAALVYFSYRQRISVVQ